MEGGNVLAEAIRAQVADTYIIVGGVGHTTETLREIARQNCGEIETEALTEAELFHLYVKKKYGLQADIWSAALQTVEITSPVCLV